MSIREKHLTLIRRLPGKWGKFRYRYSFLYNKDKKPPLEWVNQVENLLNAVLRHPECAVVWKAEDASQRKVQPDNTGEAYKWLLLTTPDAWNETFCKAGWINQLDIKGAPKVKRLKKEDLVSAKGK